jgi:hypothetical protein
MRGIALRTLPEGSPRGRTLTYDDQLHYCKVIMALSETIRLMAEIDAAIPKWPME